MKKRQAICQKFANGSCSYPNCKYSHELPANGASGDGNTRTSAVGSKLPCTFLQKFGNCRFSSSCKFSHDVTLPVENQNVTSGVSLYRGWSQLLGGIRRNTGGGYDARTMPQLSPNLTADQMEKFLGDAQKILDIGSIDTVQQLIRDLASDRGLQRVRQVAEAEFVTGYAVTSLSFKRHCIPFFKILGHEQMRASLVLESEVGTLFSFLYGPGGHRGTTFFTRAVQSLSEVADSGDLDVVENSLYHASLGLFNTLNLNHSAAVQEEFKSLALQLETLLSRCSFGSPTSNAMNYNLRSAQHEISRIKTLLHIADSLPTATAHRPEQVISSIVDSHLVDLPGELSREGPRHDNDHAEISNIKILPTSEEINSHRNEYLPHRSPDYPHHRQGIARMLDFQFRLLREDTSGQIREAVRTIIDTWAELTEEHQGKRDTKKLKTHGVRTLIYQNAQIEAVRCSPRDGIILTASFEQPKKVQALKDAARKEWWERSKYLAIGSLICLVDSLKRTTFLVVCDRRVVATDYKRRGMSDVNELPNTDLASHPIRAFITLRFAEDVTDSDVESIFQFTSAGPQVLVEFPGLLFASFDPVLRSLQQISKDGNVPFPTWLAPNTTTDYSLDPDAKNCVLVPPPLYLTKPGISLSLDSITTGEKKLRYSIGCDLEAKALEQTTTLDPGQCKALLASLSKELALIQGPPGTGKSYLGVQLVKVLLGNREVTNIGPIICVCYTNHALDQFLEHLLDSNITNIIRIGSRSKSPRVAARALHEIAQNAERTKYERYLVAKARDELTEIENNVDAACKQLLDPTSPATLKTFLESAYPAAFNDIFGEVEDDEGFMRVRKKSRGVRRDAENMLNDWLEGRFESKKLGHSNRPLEQLQTTSVLALSRIDRQRLLEIWYEEVKEQASQQLLQAAVAHGEERQSISRQRNEQERRCLQESHVIGLTTTGFASHADLIRSINAKVLICEEAAEVLEAHILTALLPTMEHAILIGDHLQLRPQIMKHEFSVENPRGGQAYGLNTSLFERMVEVERYGGKKYPVAKLDTQRRMYPSIASLIRNTLYPELKDYPSTAQHAEVPGMAKRLFWMDHRNLEASEDSLELIQTSHANEFEADMVVALVRHLSRQGVYKNGEIAVLSPYLRQLFLLRQKLASALEVIVGDRDQEQLDEAIEAGELEVPVDPSTAPARVMKKGALLSSVRVATVDNFQGEEAKVIIISLVRSNKRNKCGFLKTSNRINVLLSRARDGMYIIGNAETCGQIDMWSKVISMLERGGNIDKELQISCTRHPEIPIFITHPDDFQSLSPEGGCNERCQWRLNCGHPCVNKCHSELLHQNTMCLEPCNRSFKHCSHPCPKFCGELCGSCGVRVAGVELPCGHVPSSLLCHQLQDLGNVKCTKLIKRNLESCGHEVLLPCPQDLKTYKCRKVCGGQLSCGHQCTSVCASCTRSAASTDPEDTTTVTIHGPCRIKCGRKYSTCPHSCTKTCHGEEKCPPCSQPCAIRCDHSVCGKTCSDPCAPCPESCTWGCKHRQRCDMPCAVPCNIIPCSERCDKQLDCGHQCPSVCGETCPSIEFCQVCAVEEILNREVDLITFESYREIDIDTEPIIVPTCGHFYTMSTYDSHMRIQNAYHFDNQGQITAPRALDGSEARRSDDPDEVPEKLVVQACPDCRAPLRDIHRYNRIVKIAYLDESTRRFCITAQANYVKIYKEVSDAQLLLEANREDFLRRLKQRATSRAVAPQRLPVPIEDRMSKAHKMLQAIMTLATTVSEQEQPYARVRDMVLTQQRRDTAGNSTHFVIDNSVVQMGFRLKAYDLFIEFQWHSLWDFHIIAKSSSTDSLTQMKLRRWILGRIPSTHSICSDLIQDCTEASLAKYEVQARIWRAHLFALHRLEAIVLSQSQTQGQGQTGNQQGSQGHASNFGEEGLKEELESLNRCDTLCQQLIGSVGPLKPKVDAARTLLRGGTFYSAVTPEEKEAVYLAMAAEFSSTGRWYTCANGHPFTIGDCGAPNQLSRCPECGANIGGSYSGLTQGVRRADDFGQLDQRLGGRRR